MIHTKSGKVESDPEYQRCIRLAAEARERGELPTAIFWQRAAVKRGDDMLAEMGSNVRFGPFMDMFNTLREH